MAVLYGKEAQTAVRPVAAGNAGDQRRFAGLHCIYKPLCKLTGTTRIAHRENYRLILLITGQVAVFDTEDVEVEMVDITVHLRFLGILTFFHRNVLRVFARTIRFVREVLKIYLTNVGLRIRSVNTSE